MTGTPIFSVLEVGTMRNHVLLREMAGRLIQSQANDLDSGVHTQCSDCTAEQCPPAKFAPHLLAKSVLDICQIDPYHLYKAR